MPPATGQRPCATSAPPSRAEASYQSARLKVQGILSRTRNSGRHFSSPQPGLRLSASACRPCARAQRCVGLGRRSEEGHTAQQKPKNNLLQIHYFCCFLLCVEFPATARWAGSPRGVTRAAGPPPPQGPAAARAQYARLPAFPEASLLRAP